MILTCSQENRPSEVMWKMENCFYPHAALQVNHLISFWNVAVAHFFEWASSSNTSNGDLHKTSVVTRRLYGIKIIGVPCDSKLPECPGKCNPVLIVLKQETKNNVTSEPKPSQALLTPLHTSKDSLALWAKEGMFTSRKQSRQVPANITRAATIDQYNKLHWLHKFLELKLMCWSFMLLW